MKTKQQLGVTYSNVYYQIDTNAIYLLMDRTLRHVPNSQTWTNLAGSPPPSAPSDFVCFNDLSSAPFAIGVEIMDNAKLGSVSV